MEIFLTLAGLTIENKRINIYTTMQFSLSNLEEIINNFKLIIILPHILE